jgi:hypothetical protein
VPSEVILAADFQERELDLLDRARRGSTRRTPHAKTARYSGSCRLVARSSTLAHAPVFASAT